jgi:hypothetical protein
MPDDVFRYEVSEVGYDRWNSGFGAASPKYLIRSWLVWGRSGMDALMRCLRFRSGEYRDNSYLELPSGQMVVVGAATGPFSFDPDLQYGPRYGSRDVRMLDACGRLKGDDLRAFMELEELEKTEAMLRQVADA